MIYQGIVKKKRKEVHSTSHQMFRANKTSKISIIYIMIITEHFLIAGNSRTGFLP